MSNLSIFQNSWIDLVFEDRNKQYGAYQLRKESVKTTILALLYAFVFVVLIISFPIFLNYINGNKADIVNVNDIPKMPTLVTFSPKKSESPKKAFVQPLKSPANKSAAKPTMNKPLVVEKINESPVVPKNSEPAISSSSSSTNSTENGLSEIIPANGTSESATKSRISTVVNRNELDEKPEFPGGIKVFLNYVGTNFRTPELELEQTVKVNVSFIVEIDGSMSNIEVENDPGFGLGKEAIRVLKSIKVKWQAGQKDGQKVRTYYNLPIAVELK